MCLSKNISITYLPLFEFQDECDLFATQSFNYIKNDNHNSKTGHYIKILCLASNHLASLVHLSSLVQFKMFFFFYSFYFRRTPIFTTVQLNCNYLRDHMLTAKLVLQIQNLYLNAKRQFKSNETVKTNTVRVQSY